MTDQKPANQRPALPEQDAAGGGGGEVEEEQLEQGQHVTRVQQPEHLSTQGLVAGAEVSQEMYERHDFNIAYLTSNRNTVSKRTKRSFSDVFVLILTFEISC